MSNQRQKGFVAAFLTAILVLGLLFAMFFVRFRINDEVTSGIAYNTTNNSLIGGNTHFGVRASEQTYTTSENASYYCLPGDSPYKELVNRAAGDKRVKIKVESSKFFAIKAPWVCQDNVVVTEVKDEQ